ncbi:septum site-determining protein MinC [Ramlibacter sp.]|uniref:septum site-determining protein MinC n=1 Tax=Ramlibacter sp. TaxID=1917967 RepID=UPI003D13287B
MTVALAGRAPATFEIKSANLPLVALLLKSGDLALLADELAARFGDIPDFFDQDPLVIDLTPLGGGDVDFDALQRLLRGYRVQPIAVKGGTEAQMASALACGLVAANEVAVREPRPARPSEPVAAAVAPEPATEPVPAAPVPLDALVIDKPLRSGQQVYARNRDLIVLAMVNPGAEVIADGNIHVYAPLRGKAIAGARGNTEARIFTLALDPELVSIAGVYRPSETPLPAELHGKPAQIHLAGEKLVMQPLKS